MMDVALLWAKQVTNNLLPNLIENKLMECLINPWMSDAINIVVEEDGYTFQKLAKE